MPLNCCEIPYEDFFNEVLPGLGADTHFHLQPGEIPVLEEHLVRGATDSFVEYLCGVIGDWLTASQLRCTVKNTGDAGTPSLCVYDDSETARQAYTSGLILRDRSASNPSDVAGVAWAWVTTIFEVDVRPEDFCDRYKGCLEPKERTHLLLSRSIVFVQRIMRHQHRRHVLSVTIQGREVRFACWDHAGAILTEPIDYLKDAGQLFRFLYIYATSTRATQGYDDTVVSATTEQILKLAAYQPDDKYDEAARTELLRAKEEIFGTCAKDRIISPIVCVQCDDVGYRQSCVPALQRTHCYLIGRYRAATRTIFGAGTKGFVAYDVDHNELVFIKDHWLEEGADQVEELKIYEVLHAAGTRYVATALAGGFVGTQVTMTQDHFGMDVDIEMPRRRRHYRFVVQQIGRSLWMFKDTRELVSTVHDAMRGHHDAYERARVFHPDVSTENILADIVTGRGFLNDWDQAILRDDPSCHNRRTGTWEFMSAALQIYPSKPTTLSDSLESFVWSLIPPIVRHTLHSYSRLTEDGDRLVIDKSQHNYDISLYLRGLLLEKTNRDGHLIGGERKIRQVLHMDSFEIRMRNKDSPLEKILQSLHDLMREFYLSLDQEEMDKKWGAAFVEVYMLPWKRNLKGPTTRSTCLDTHERMLTIFSNILDDPSLDWTDERTEDQFTGRLSEVYCPSTGDRPLQYGLADPYRRADSDSGSESERESKRARRA